jgi:hypothetical protein
MQPLFSSLVVDVLYAAICGLLGGFGLGLLQDKGIEIPRRRTALEEGDTTPTAYLDFGFAADMFIGALAASIVYALNPPANQIQLIGTSLIAGLGGAGILKGYVEGRRSDQLNNIANEVMGIAQGVVGQSTERSGSATTSAATASAARAERLSTLDRQLQDLQR